MTHCQAQTVVETVTITIYALAPVCVLYRINGFGGSLPKDDICQDAMEMVHLLQNRVNMRWSCHHSCRGT